MARSNQGSTTPTITANSAKRNTAPDIAPKKTASKNKKTTAKTTPPDIVSTEKRLQMIREFAYSLAEQRGFTSGNEQSDWLQAENQIDALLLK